MTLNRDPFNEGLDEAKSDGADFAIEAELGLNKDEFDGELDEARGDLDELDATRAEPEVGLETDDFDADRDDVKGRLDELDADRADPTVGLDSADAEDKIAAIYAMLDILKTDTATAKVDIDDRDALAKLAAISAATRSIGSELDNGQSDPGRLDELGEQVEGLDASFQALTTDSEDASTALDDVGGSADDSGGKLDRMASSADHANSSMGGLIGTAVALAPALLTIGEVGAAGLFGFAAMAASATVGLGAFAIAAEGDLKGVEGQVKSMLASFQAANATAVLPAVHAALPVIAGLFRDITPLVATTGRALTTFENTASSALGSPMWRSFFNYLGGEAGASITTFGHLIDGAGTALMGLDRAFQPVISAMEHAFDDLAAKMAAFGQAAGAGGDSGLNSFIAFVVREAPVVGQLLGQIGDDIGELARDLEPLGGSELDVLNVFAKAIGDIANVSPGLVQAAGGLYTLSKAASLLGISSAGVSGFVSDIGRLPLLLNGAGGAASGLGKIAAYAGTAVSGLATLGLTLGDIAGPAGIAAAAILSFTHVMSAGLDSESGSASTWVKSFSEGLLQVRNPIQTTEVAIKQLQAQMASYSSQMNKLNELASKGKETNAQADQYQRLSLALEQAGDKVTGLLTVEKTLEAQQKVSASAVNDSAIAARNGSSANALYAASALAAGSKAHVAAAGVSSLADAITDSRISAGASVLDAYKSAVDAVNSSVSNASTAMTDFSNALQIAGGNQLSATTANTTLQQSLQSVQSALAGTTLDMKSNSTQQLAAQQSAESFAQQLRTTTEANLANGESAVTVAANNKTMVAAFDATALGANAPKTAVDALNKTLGLTPLTKTTTLKQLGAQSVISQAHAEQTALERLQRTFTATTTVNDGQALGAISTVLEYLHSIPSSVSTTVTVNTIHNNTTNDVTTSSGGGSPGPRPHAIAANTTSAAQSISNNVARRLGLNLGGATSPFSENGTAPAGGVPHGGATERISYASQIAAARAALAAERQMAASISQGIQGQYSIILGPAAAKPSVRGAGPGHAGGVQKTPPPVGIIAQLKKDAAQVKKYNDILQRLKKLGLDYALLQELADAGPAAGMETAEDLLKGGKKEIDAANGLEGTIIRNSNAIGKLAASANINGKQEGEAQTKGYLEGLLKDQKKVEAAIAQVLTVYHKAFDADIAKHPFDLPIVPTAGKPKAGGGISATGLGGEMTFNLGGVHIEMNGTTLTKPQVTQAVETGISRAVSTLTRDLGQFRGRSW